MSEIAVAPLRDPNAAITHAVVRRALPDHLWALYGRTRAGLGGLDVRYQWRDDLNGWVLAVAAGDRLIAAILLTDDPLIGEVELGQGEAAALLAAPALLSEARAALERAAAEGMVRRIRWPLRTDADILGFLSLVRAKAEAT